MGVDHPAIGFPQLSLEYVSGLWRVISLGMWFQRCSSILAWPTISVWVRRSHERVLKIPRKRKRLNLENTPNRAVKWSHQEARLGFVADHQCELGSG